ncbi:hypothetical protein BX600DRAFT_470357 [Xylariales sp. PMI_506]|nr:hypothetical protein BX600DRAFT_470357 [Xylariales sp. PMI_506]
MPSLSAFTSLLVYTALVSSRSCRASDWNQLCRSRIFSSQLVRRSPIQEKTSLVALPTEFHLQHPGRSGSRVATAFIAAG